MLLFKRVFLCQSPKKPWSYVKTWHTRDFRVVEVESTLVKRSFNPFMPIAAKTAFVDISLIKAFFKNFLKEKRWSETNLHLYFKWFSNLWLTLPMLRLLSTKTKGSKDFWKPSKPCCVGTHWISLTEYSQMSTHLPGFRPYFSVFCIILYWPN